MAMELADRRPELACAVFSARYLQRVMQDAGLVDVVEMEHSECVDTIMMD